MRAIRMSRRLRQVDVAKEIGISKTHYAKIESGNNAPSESVLRLFSVCYGVNPEWLRTGTGEERLDWAMRVRDMTAEGLGERAALGKGRVVREARGAYGTKTPEAWREIVRRILDDEGERMQYAMDHYGVTLEEALAEVARAVMKEGK